MAGLPDHIPVKAQPTRMNSSPDQKRFNFSREVAEAALAHASGEMTKSLYAIH
jgi:hypothetical protein